MTAIRTWLALACALAVAPAGAFQSSSSAAGAPEAAPWHDFTEVTLNISPVGSKSTATYHARLDFETNDLAIDVDVRDPPQWTHGSVGVIGGRVLITKGLALAKGEENDAIDGPMLTIQLVERVLERVLPGGPASITKPTRIDYAGKEPVEFATPSASGRLPMPWTAKGEVRKSKSGAVEFNFDITAGAPGSKGAMRNRCIGALNSRSGPVFADSMALAGWTTYPDDARSKTVGQVRARIAQGKKK